MKFYDQISATIPKDIAQKRAHIVGGGIAGLAASVYLIQDAQMPAANITIYDTKSSCGGALEAFGNAEQGYLSTGSREPEPYFECMWDLCRRIPSLEHPGKTVLDETVEFNKQNTICCHTRFLENCGQAVPMSQQAPMDEDSAMRLMKLLLTPDNELDNVRLCDWFTEEYFKSSMWLEFSTKLAFQDFDSALEMKMYVLRFLHLGEGTAEHKGILHFKYDEFDSLAKPILEYLNAQGVHFEHDVTVTDFALEDKDGLTAVTGIHMQRGEKEAVVKLSGDDYVFFTSGSMIQNATYGDNTTVAYIDRNMEKRGCFTLWEKLAKHDEKFGHPEKFISDVDKTNWMSFSITIRDYPQLIQEIERITGDKAGQAGVVTFRDSAWMLSTYVQHKPFFPGQPESVEFITNYGLHPWNDGDYIKKPMSQCTGIEIMKEYLYHLGLKDKIDEILPHCTIRTSMMPYITSQFMPRQSGDRPQVIPQGCTNLALMGQYVETGDVIFTVETSIRSAMMAVYNLLKLDKPVIPIAPTMYDIRVIASMIRMTTGNGELITEVPQMTPEMFKEVLLKIPAFGTDM